MALNAATAEFKQTNAVEMNLNIIVIIRFIKPVTNTRTNIMPSSITVPVGDQVDVSVSFAAVDHLSFMAQNSPASNVESHLVVTMSP